MAHGLIHLRSCFSLNHPPENARITAELTVRIHRIANVSTVEFVGTTLESVGRYYARRKPENLNGAKWISFSGSSRWVSSDVY